MFRDPFEGYRDGACRGSGVDFIVNKVTREHRDICDSCPVFQKCKDYAVPNEKWNVWAKTSPITRKKMRTLQGLPEPKLFPLKERQAS